MPKTNPSPLPITVISAGAGSGKTYSLTQRMVEMLQTGVRPAGIIATTFTKKAAAELQDRVRVKLLEEGLPEAANELGAALIGTVHSIGTRLLQRFAFEAGVSPLVEIIAEEDSSRMFNESLSQVLTETRIEKLNQLADRLGLSKKKQGDEPFDWRRTIHEITDVARANNFSIEILEKSKRLSWETFKRFLPDADEKINDLTANNRLLAHLEQTAKALSENENDATKTTKDVALELAAFANQLRYRGELYWHEWVKIGKSKVGAKSRDLFADLAEFAGGHLAHPRFQTDIQQFIETIFEISMDGLREFQNYKTKRGLIDYTDMEAQVSQLLRSESVRETLRSELDLLLVDEFQDTSPIQLDIFLQLSRLAKHSIWVGDPKQSIYGFRGAEPRLMQAIIEKTGGVRPENILGKSWRSREDVVRAVNSIFTKAFDTMPREQVELEPVRTRAKEPDGTPLALVHWHFKSDLEEKRPPAAPWMENCIATQIQTLLERELPILPKAEKNWRAAQPGDVAILCRSNDACQKMAEALHRAGLKASIARAGLLETKEARLVMACLKFLLTPSDALSMAEIRLLASGESLETIVDDRVDYLARRRDDENSNEFWSADNQFLRKLMDDLRPRTADLSASEILSLLLDELDLRRVVVAMGNPAQRLDNLDQLRKLTLDYENACTRLHSAATLGGFLLWLDALGRAELDAQGSGESPDAVRVMTYHKSKGLEFPVTICHNLSQNLKEKIWGANLVAETDEVDLDNILGNRWLRFWVNPYDDQIKNTVLMEAVETSEEFAEARIAAANEEARLLYVGLTRARDYLVFPTNKNPAKWLNRVFNRGDENIPTLDPNSQETPFYHGDDVLLAQTEVIYKEKDFPTAHRIEPAARFHAVRSGLRPHSGFRVDTTQPPPGWEGSFDTPIAFGESLDAGEEHAASLHKALISILLADSLKYPKEERLALVRQQLTIRGVPPDAIEPARVLRQSDLFFQFLKEKFAPKKLKRALQTEMMWREKLLEMQVDFVVTPTFQSVSPAPTDQKVGVTFAPPADLKKPLKLVLDRFAPQLAWTGVALQNIFPDSAIELWAVVPEHGVFAKIIFENG